MSSTDENVVAFRGISPKPPLPPDWLYLLKHSEDYGGWRNLDTEERHKKKKKGKKSHGKR